MDGPLYRDFRDDTPFAGVIYRSSLRKFTDDLGRQFLGQGPGPTPGRFLFRGRPARLPVFSPPVAKAIHAELKQSRGHAPYLVLASEYPGSAGLLHVLAGLRAFQDRHFERAAELLLRGERMPVDEYTYGFALRQLRSLLVEVELNDQVSIKVLYSREAVLFALAHAFREIGEHGLAVQALAQAPNSPAKAIALAHLASLSEDPESTIRLSEGVRNAVDINAALLLARARAQRLSGHYKAAEQTLGEILRRKSTAPALKTSALTERGLLYLDAGWKVARSNSRPGAVVRKERSREKADHRRWDTDFRGAGKDS